MVKFRCSKLTNINLENPTVRRRKEGARKRSRIPEIAKAVSRVGHSATTSSPTVWSTRNRQNPARTGAGRLVVNAASALLYREETFAVNLVENVKKYSYFVVLFWLKN